MSAMITEGSFFASPITVLWNVFTHPLYWIWWQEAHFSEPEKSPFPGAGAPSLRPPIAARVAQAKRRQTHTPLGVKSFFIAGFFQEEKAGIGAA
jgi:hypothetical protein